MSAIRHPVASPKIRPTSVSNGKEHIANPRAAPISGTESGRQGDAPSILIRCHDARPRTFRARACRTSPSAVALRASPRALKNRRIVRCGSPVAYASAWIGPPALSVLGCLRHLVEPPLGQPHGDLRRVSAQRLERLRHHVLGARHQIVDEPDGMRLRCLHYAACERQLNRA